MKRPWDDEALREQRPLVKLAKTWRVDWDVALGRWLRRWWRRWRRR